MMINTTYTSHFCNRIHNSREKVAQRHLANRNGWVQSLQKDMKRIEEYGAVINGKVKLPKKNWVGLLRLEGGNRRWPIG